MDGPKENFMISRYRFALPILAAFVSVAYSWHGRPQNINLPKK
jgi:hypothetical protein